MKKIFIITAVILMITMLPFALFSCNGSPESTEASTSAPTEKPTEAPTEEPTEAPTEEPTEKPTYDDAELTSNTYTFTDDASAAKIKRIGRTMMNTTKGICFDHTATGIEFNAVVEGDITIDILCEAVNDNEAYLTIFIDGQRKQDIYTNLDTNGNGKRGWANCHVQQGQSTVTIATGLKKGEHNIRIIKQTEANYSLLSIKSISMKGELLDRPADKQYYIEFIGDSLTCGMGAVGNTTITSAQGMNGADWEDGTLGYAFLTAEQLGADYSIVSESGIGVASSWFDPIGDFYTKASYKRDGRTEYDFANARKPDLVVINLGTNDYYLNSTYPDRAIVSQLKNKTKELINTVRAKYGEDTPILWVSGIWSNVSADTDVIKQIDAAIKELGGEIGDIYRLTINENAQNKMGAENHPSQKGHQQTAKEVVAYIRENNLLG